MPDHNPSVDVTESIDPVTATLVLPHFGEDELPPDETQSLGEENWPAQTVKRGLHLRMPTAILFALLLAAGGLWGGSLLQKHEGGSPGATGLAGARAGFSRTGGTGSPFASGSSSTATTGTVTDIIGNTLYVTESSGSLVKVTLSSSATVTRNAKSSLAALKPGDTVVVQGTKVSGGSMTASSVSATAAGVSSPTPGAGFGGAFGGAASRSGGSS
jgi:hypothetical protein